MFSVDSKGKETKIRGRGKDYHIFKELCCILLGIERWGMMEEILRNCCEPQMRLENDDGSERSIIVGAKLSNGHWNRGDRGQPSWNLNLDLKYAYLNFFSDDEGDLKKLVETKSKIVLTDSYPCNGAWSMFQGEMSIYIPQGKGTTKKVPVTQGSSNQLEFTKVPIDVLEYLKKHYGLNIMQVAKRGLLCSSWLAEVFLKSG